MTKALLQLITRPLVRPRASPPSRHLVAIVIPLSANPRLTDEEEISLRQLSHHLGAYDKFLVAPEGHDIARRGFQTRYFPRKFFGSAAAHARLMMRTEFYRTFEDYDYILIYHPDSLVLSDDLARWCEAGWDYIGAPWVPCDDTPWVREARVGNGGFTLMRVDRVLQVLENRYRADPASYWCDRLLAEGARVDWFFRLLQRLQRVLPGSRALDRLVHEWRVSRDPARHGQNNDFFWSYYAVSFLPTFKVAPVEEGLRFAFEAAPRLCFELNHRQLPFGCHAWTKFDRDFWVPHLVAETPAA